MYNVIQQLQKVIMNTALSIRIPEKLNQQLCFIAQETERSKSFFVQKALEFYIEDCADLQLALDRFRDPTDTKVSSKEMRKSLGL